MSIGEAIAQARRSAGLSITEVSRMTRIRDAIISGIEHDDYSGCGGDFYARGNIRAIATAIGIDPRPLIREYDATRRSPETISAAQAFEPVMPIARERRRFSIAAIAGMALVVAAGIGGYVLISGGGQAPRVPAAAATARQAATHPAAAARPSTGHSASAPAPTRSPAPVRSAPVTLLKPVSIAAFGPAGTSQGDSPQLASSALHGNPATPWHSDWYTTAKFGNLQTGTGLLLDMGHPVTVRTVQIALGSRPGADIELRIGNTPSLAGLRQVARAADVGGVVRMSPPAARGRYVLVWFTKLPPDPAGTFQVSVYRITVRGTR